MPAQAPATVDPMAQRDLERLGERLRTHRKSMRLAAESVARAANMSRQTLHRIERGEPSVTMGAYVNALRALGLELKVVGTAPAAPAGEVTDAVRLADYPQLEGLAWHRQGETLTEQEALALYERNWRHVDRPSLEPAEREFIARLVKRHGKGALLV
jgi:transcriptional regulator with XRE-family HTH domain